MLNSLSISDSFQIPINIFIFIDTVDRQYFAWYTCYVNTLWSNKIIN